MIAPCRVLDLTNVEDGIIKEDLVKHGIKQGDFVILKPEIPLQRILNRTLFMSKKAVQNTWSVSGLQGSGSTHWALKEVSRIMLHRLLLGKGIHILEGLRLKDVEEGNYTLVAAPLSIRDVEASPVRALLLKE